MENKETVLDVKVQIKGMDEAIEKARVLEEIIKSAKTLVCELTDLIEKLEVDV